MNLIKSCCLFVVFSSFLACTSQVSDVKSVSYTEFVNPFIGTDFTGNTYPGAQAPFGMVQLSPDNGLPGWDRISGYFYPDSTIAGFSHTHLSGTGAGDLYDISFMPVTLPYKEAEAPLGIHSLFSHSEESASAGYYQVRLKDYNINVELTATERCGIQRYTFPKADGLKPTFSIMYHFENSVTNRLVYLFVLDVEDDSILCDPRFKGGKLWQFQQVEQNLGHKFLSECFEEENEHFKNVIGIREKYREF